MKDPLFTPPPVWPLFWSRSIRRLQKSLLKWHQTQGRHHLPWKSKDPYAIWVSEIMLQQTQVSTVIPKFNHWMKRFPSITELAKAPSDDVLKCWEGLGYYSRARNLHASAKIMVEKYQGKVPHLRADRLALPGIGPSTASAIGAFGFEEREAIFDGNVRRVWSRWWGDRLLVKSEKETLAWGWAIAQSSTPTSAEEIAPWTQAIMDLGATVCLPKNPLCEKCPWQNSCRSKATGQQSLYPPPRRKVQRLPEALNWMWVTDGKGRVAVCAPEVKGKWSGLWKMPELKTKTPVSPIIFAQGEHQLTHRQIYWTVSHISNSIFEAPTVVWLTQSQWDEKAWPRFLRRWWDELPEIERQKLFKPQNFLN